jgi:hypothetical protein
MDNENLDSEIQVPPKKKKLSKQYAISITLVCTLTFVSLFYSFYGAGEGNVVAGFNLIGSALISCNPWWLLCIALLMISSYLLDGLIILIFCRLYTRHYAFRQGVASSMMGAFYNSVTPASSGGQVMQVYTLKKQGIEVSNAASIMVMWFILYQSALIVFDVIAILFEWKTISSITSFQIPNFSLGGWDGKIPMVPLIVVGFALNLSVIVLLFLMSYSHKFHNFIMHYIVSALARLKIVKDPDKTRENLRVQVENFKIELKRLQANVPVTILIFLIFMGILFVRYSVPYFAGLALSAYGVDEGFTLSRLFDACFRSAFHQMVTGLVPIPGSAGVSELFFSAMFSDFYVESQKVTASGLVIIRSSSANIMAAQILWRVATFHLVVIVSGLVAALYHSRPKESYASANRQTFVDLQLATFDERKASSDTLYETKQLSRKEIQDRLSSLGNQGYETGDGLIAPPPRRKKDLDKKKKKNGEIQDTGDIGPSDPGVGL